MSNDLGSDSLSSQDLEQRFRRLLQQYGEDAVRTEGHRVLQEAIVNNAPEVAEAISAGDFESLGREALAGLAILAALPDENELDSLLDRSSIPDSNRPVVRDLWTKAIAAPDVIQHRAREILGSFSWEHALSESSLSTIEAALEPRRLAQQQSDLAMLATYDSLLTFLLQGYLSGADITERLNAAVRDVMFRAFLDRLVVVHEQSTDPSDDPVVQAANRYSLVTRKWHDMRLSIGGRANHWVSVSHDKYFDLDTGYPQLELRVYTYSRELFHTKDDVDDILNMAVTFLGLCADCLEATAGRYGFIAPDMASATNDALFRVDGYIQRIRKLTTTEMKSEAEDQS